MEAFGFAILLSGALSLAVTFLTGVSTAKGASVAFFALAVAGIALGMMTWRSAEIAVIELPMMLAMLVVGLSGGLPGAGLGGWLRRKVRREN